MLVLSSTCFLFLLAIGLGFIALIAQTREIRARYPMTFNRIQFPAQLSDSNELTTSELHEKRRNPLLSARYKNVFGNPKVVEGSAFIPNTMDAYTGKLSSSRKEVFNWQPKKSLLEYFLFRK